MTHAEHKQEWTVTTEDGIPVVRDGKLTLTGFLLTRIAEDAELANLAAVPVWRYQLWAGEDRIIDVDDTESDPVVAVFNGLDMDAMHAGRWFPARVLAECEAKRRIVAVCGESACGGYEPPGSERRAQYESLCAEHPETGAHLPDAYSPGCDGCSAAYASNRDARQILALLALPYADHPDYRQEWRP